MGRHKPLPSREELSQYFHYEITSGRLFRVNYDKHRGVAHECAVREIVPNTPQGYACVRFKNKLYRCHRIIWVLVTGIDPGSMEIDHIDRNTQNNAWHNLRLATSHEQALNRKVRRDSTTGFRGVINTGKKYQAKIQRNGVREHLGTFDTPLAAGNAYKSAASRVMQ